MKKKWRIPRRYNHTTPSNVRACIQLNCAICHVVYAHTKSNNTRDRARHPFTSRLLTRGYWLCLGCFVCILRENLLGFFLLYMCCIVASHFQHFFASSPFRSLNSLGGLGTNPSICHFRALFAPAAKNGDRMHFVFYFLSIFESIFMFQTRENFFLYPLSMTTFAVSH